MRKTKRERKMPALIQCGKGMLSLLAVVLTANLCTFDVQATVSSGDAVSVQTTVSSGDSVGEQVQEVVSAPVLFSVRAATSQITLEVSEGQDISEALQSAVKNYKEVTIPAGNYYCSAIKMNNLDGVTIYAQGATITQNGTGNPIIYTSNGTTASNISIVGGTWNAGAVDLPAFRFYGNVQNITLSDLTVTNSLNAGIRFKESTNVVLSKVTSTENGGYGVIFEAVAGASVDNSTFSKSSSGINFKGCTGDLIVTFTQCLNNSDNGILVSDCPKITVNDCELNYNEGGLRVSGVSEKVSLSRNNMKNNTGMGIRIFDCTGDVAYSKNYAYDNGKTGVSMENCTGIVSLYRVNAKRNGDCGFAVTNSTNIKINKCVASNNTNVGINLDGNTADSGYKYCVNMKYSTVASNGGIGIRVVNCAQTNIQETTTEKNGANGVYSMDCEAVTLNQLIAQNNKSNGASLNNTAAVKAANCTFDSNTANGLRMDNVSKTWVTNGVYSNNGETGLAMSNIAQLSVKNPVLHDNTGYGLNIDTITVSGLVKNAESYNNKNIGIRYKDSLGKINTQYSKVYGNANSGIYGVNCENMVVNGCEVYENAGFGINATDSPLANVKYCNVHDNKDSGIRYSGCKKVILTDSDSNGNVNAGIYAGDCTTITFNLAEVKNNTGFGINVNNGTAVSTVDCIAEGNTDTGFRYNACKRVKVTGSTSDKNGMGVYGEAITGYITVSNVDVNSNNGYGINLKNSVNVTVENCTSVGNSDSGYLFTESEAVVNNCESSQNGAHGAYISDSTVTLNDMLIQESYWCGLSVSGTKASATVNGGKYINNGTRPDQYEDDDNLCAGIGVYDGANAVITEAICNNNHGCGITAAGPEDGAYMSTISVYGCDTIGNNDHGVGARPYGKINICASESGRVNTIQNNKHSGFIINDHCIADYVKDCIISGNGKHGISASENSNITIIENNTISGNTEDGIHVSSNSSAVIKNTSSNDNVLSGLGVYSNSKVSVSDSCTFNGNAHYGVCIDTSTASKVEDCTIDGNTWAGVVVRNAGEIQSLANCEISNNETYGVYCSEGAKFAASNLTITNSVNDGVRITGAGSEGTLTDVTSKDNQQNGIVVTDGGCLSSAKNITTTGNAKHGLAVYEASTVGSTSGITSSGNGEKQIYVATGAVTDLTTK